MQNVQLENIISLCVWTLSQQKQLIKHTVNAVHIARYELRANGKHLT